MAEIPEEAIQAAERAVRDGMRIRLGENALAIAGQGQPLMLSGAEAELAARLALEAAAPFIAAQTLIRERRRAVRLVRRKLVPLGCEPTQDAVDLVEAIKGDRRLRVAFDAEGEAS